MKYRGQERKFNIGKVQITHISVPDADQRIISAFNMLLQVAESHISPSDGVAEDRSKNKQKKKMIGKVMIKK